MLLPSQQPRCSGQCCKNVVATYASAVGAAVVVHPMMLTLPLLQVFVLPPDGASALWK